MINGFHALMNCNWPELYYRKYGGHDGIGSTAVDSKSIVCVNDLVGKGHIYSFFSVKC
jgi:hypothetical protein